jgi:hypothetical protein
MVRQIFSRRVRLALLLAVTAGFAVTASPGQDAATKPATAAARTPDDDLVDELADDSVKIRTQAQKDLATEGTAAEPRLIEALTDPRPEVRTRALAALRRIRLVRRPGLEPQVIGLAKAYLDTADTGGRQNLLKRIMAFQPAAEPALLRLYSMEGDSELRSQILHQIGSGFEIESARLIEEGDLDAVGMILEGMIDNGTATGARDYAVYAMLTGRSEQATRRWRSEWQNGEGESKKTAATVLAFLYKVAGEHPRQAAEMAREADNPKLTLAIVAGQSDWLTFEDDTALLTSFAPVIQAGFRAACKRLMGQPEAAAGILAKADLSGADDESVLVPSRVFLLNDDPAKGIELLTNSRPDIAIRLLTNRGEYDRALAVAKSAAGNQADSALINLAVLNIRQTLGLDPPLPESADAPGEIPGRPHAVWDQALSDLKAKKFKSAAWSFGMLARSNPTVPAYLYLQGYATSSDGDPAAGQKLIDTARLVPLGDPYRRWQMAATLDEAGLSEQAEAESALALRCTSMVAEIGAGEIYNDRATRAIAAGKWKEAADNLDRLTFMQQSPDVQWNDLMMYMTVPATAHLMHARDFWARNLHKESLAEYDRYETYLPTDAGEVIESVAKLDAAGDHAGATARFDRLWNLLTAGCKAYPKSPLLNNNAAWLGACCGRNLDDSLKYAEAANTLEHNAGSMDTLAEVHFRRGERADAAALSAKILQLVPDDEYAKRQAARFAHAAVPSTTQPVDEPK